VGGVMKYKQFLNKKLKFGGSVGFNCNGSISKNLYDFQSYIVKIALLRGRYAIFADCGLGKTLMQLEWAKQIIDREGGYILIVAPLAVSLQTKREGMKSNVDVNICRSMDNIKPGINITNYEMLEKFDPGQFIGVVLDESSILKSHTGKYRNTIITMFANTKYKLSCTATPAPNDYVELGNQCEFLGVMSRKEMLSMFFINDTANVGSWRLKGHAEKEFYKWLSTWSVMIKSPADLGFKDDKFKLPKLNINEVIVDTEHKPMDGFLFEFEAQTLKERREARKNAVEQKIDAIKELINKSKDQWLIWVDFNNEGEMCKNAIDGVVEIKGSDTNEHKERSVIDFANGDIQFLVTKPSIAGFGINWQSCHNVIFVGVSDSYESFYQAVRRCWRYGQKEDVNVYVLTSHQEGAILRNIKRKEQDAERMFSEMVKNANRERSDIKVKQEYEVAKVQGDMWEVINGDCVEVIKNVETESIHYSLFSPPFASLFTYSNSERDMGNCRGKDDFLEHFKFLASELFRVLMSGRLLSFHVMNLPATISQDGFIGIKDLRGDLIRLFESVGFIFHSEVCVWKDPLVQATRTKTLTLAHKQISKDATRCGQGYADYIITMRKNGDNVEPVAKGRGFERFIGDGEVKARKTNDARTNKYSHHVWQKYASPVWMDIRQTRVLNARVGREEKDEKHMCPLQLDVIERCYELWTNEGDLILSPFAGIGSEGYCAVKEKRRFIGIELKKSYFDVAVKNLKRAEDEAKEKVLF
jgi:hypothetical protein